MCADGPAMVSCRGAALLLACLLAIPAGAASLSEGESVYRTGTLPSGNPVQAERVPGVRAGGHDAACVNCHRRSGLGGEEGRYIIPPIAGKFLFPPADGDSSDRDVLQAYGVGHRHAPYTDASLARAVREGIDADGNDLSDLMPRFRLDDGAMASLTAYLRGLARGPVPGVTEDTLHFATIITPDADPVKRQAMLGVLENFFAGKNAFFRESPKLHTAKAIRYRVSRKWQLHVWELSGAPETWEQQLHEHLVAEPVFAVISGIGGKTWEPVHRFCEREALPCLFPNVELPVVAERDFYSVYFSKGVLLEAELLAKRLAGESGAAPKRVIQIYRKGDVGEAAAEAAGKLLAGRMEVLNRALGAGDARQQLSQALQGAGPGTTAILWLRPGDLAQLPAAAAGKLNTAFMSGLLGGMDNVALPAEWRAIMRMTYPIDLPERRKVRMNYSTNWLKIQHIPVADERLQADTYLACRILSESLGMMLDVFVRDYLVERVEDMLGRMIVTGYYPRLGLAQGQRFASKGGYLVRFAGTQMVADGEWMVP